MRHALHGRRAVPDGGPNGRKASGDGSANGAANLLIL
jgi:hypothetical protein